MSAKVRPHSSLVDSGVQGLGDVPRSWRVMKLRNILRRRTKRNQPDLPLLSVVREKGVILRDTTSVEENHNYIPEDLSSYKVVRIGQFAVNKMKAWQGSYGVSGHDGIVSPAYYVFDVFGVDASFFHVAIRSGAYVPSFTRASDGVRIGQWDLAETQMREIPFLIPTPTEQREIVRFLDRADERIQRYIHAKQKLIALLEEQRKAIIERAVSGQIDVETGRPHRAYKDSRVDWLDDIPQHWSVVRLKFLAERIVDCLHETPEYSENGMFPAIRTADISPGMVRLESARRIEYQEYARWTERLEPRRNDILYSREGERYGIAACVPDGVRLCISQRMMVFRIRAEHNPVFVMWALNSRQAYAQACQDIMGATAPHVNVSTIRNYCLAIPDRGEQDAIVDMIERDTRGFSSAIARARSCIARAWEYQERLVADIAIGSLDVRDAAFSMARVSESEDESPLLERGAEYDADERGSVFEHAKR